MKTLTSLVSPTLEDANVNSIAKRVLDYVIGIPLFLVFLPIMALVALFIKVVDPGSIFFVQEREGLRGRCIRVIKFRTMYVDGTERLKAYFEQYPEKEAEWKKFYKLDPDPRIIPFGIFLRKSSLDELPNIFNLLKGDISLVGPRPFPYYHLDDFTPEFRELRRSVWPGITGLWQIERGDMETQERLDTEYIENWSFAMDVKILLRTVPVFLLAKKPHF